METVVMMSTYNGSKFVLEQIESIFESNPRMTVYIHDDGSSDNTVEQILLAYQDDNRVNMFKTGEKLGVKKAFLTLLAEIEADYYFFSDQDDVWEKNKVEVFLNKAEKLSPNRPGLLYSELQLVDENNTSMGETMGQHYGWTQREREQKASKILFSNRVTGASMMVNKAMHLFIKHNINDIDIKKIAMHDSFLAKTALMFDNLLFISDALTRYRQHSQNVVGVKIVKKNIKGRLNVFKQIIDETFLVKKLVEGSTMMDTRYRRILNILNDYYSSKAVVPFVGVLLSPEIPYKKRLMMLIFRKYFVSGHEY